MISYSSIKKRIAAVNYIGTTLYIYTYNKRLQFDNKNKKDQSL